MPLKKKNFKCRETARLCSASSTEFHEMNSPVRGELDPIHHHIPQNHPQMVKTNRTKQQKPKASRISRPGLPSAGKSRKPAVRPQSRRAGSNQISSVLTPHLKMVNKNDPAYKHIARQAADLHHDTLSAQIFLPSNNYNGTYYSGRLTATYQPVIGTSTANGFSLLLNPWLCFATLFSYEKMTAGVTTVYDVPTAFTNSATTATPIPNSTNATALTFQGATSTSSTTPYGGRVRVRGVQYEIIYTGPQSARGGVIYALTNGNRNSYINQSNTTNAFNSSGNSIAALIRQNQDVSIHTVQNGFKFVWRPTDTDFKEINTFVPDAVPVVAATSSQNPVVGEFYIPDSESEMQTARAAGWESGFVFVPATSTAASAANYIVKIDIEFESSVRLIDGVSVGSTAFPNNQSTYCHPNAHAAAQNMLTAVHKVRKEHTAPVTATSLGLEAFHALTNTASAQADAFLSDLASTMFAAL